MLCPEVWNFPAPKVITSTQKSEDLEPVLHALKLNNFYKSLIITCPDELQLPSEIEDLLVEDTDYYKITKCSLTGFLEPSFIENFVKNGELYCLSSNRNCVVDTCFAITPDGILTIHVPQYIYQSLGIEGTKRSHNFYEVAIDLKNINHFGKIEQCLSKLQPFDFNIYWEPSKEDICPSSIAKYFYDKKIKVEQINFIHKSLKPEVTEVPSPNNTDLDEMVEWIGMLAIQGDLYPKETYISTYYQPESNNCLKTTRICINILQGFIPPHVITKICKNLWKYVVSRSLDNYWTAISFQSDENSIWQWTPSSPKMFQAHDNTCNIFIMRDQVICHSIGDLKHS